MYLNNLKIPSVFPLQTSFKAGTETCRPNSSFYEIPEASSHLTFHEKLLLLNSSLPLEDFITTYQHIFYKCY